MEQNKKELTLNQLKSAYVFCKEKRNAYWKECKTQLSKLVTTLQVLSDRNEDSISKQDLVECLKLQCDYMKVYSLYRYYKDSTERLFNQLQGI